MAYKLSDLTTLRPYFRACFPDSPPLDELMYLKLSTLMGQVVIDILKFDEWLHKVHGNYDNTTGESIDMLILREYGDEALALLNELLP